MLSIAQVPGSMLTGSTDRMPLTHASSGSVEASVVIATRNRAADVRRAVASCFAQCLDSLEVIVVDDASEDGTGDLIEELFPAALVLRNSCRQGVISARNLGLQRARGRFIVSIDDDAYFSQNDIVPDVLAIFERDESVGAVAIRYIEPFNPRSLSQERSDFPTEAGQEVRTFTGCAYAIRRDAALAIGGYRHLLVQGREERDLCIRLMDAGWRIVYGRAAYVVHTVSPIREPRRKLYFRTKNEILFSALNLPIPEALGHAIWGPVALIAYRFSWRTTVTKLLASLAGFWCAVRYMGHRRPVSRETYRRYLRLPGHGPETWQGAAPLPCHEAASSNAVAPARTAIHSQSPAGRRG